MKNIKPFQVILALAFVAVSSLIAARPCAAGTVTSLADDGGVGTLRAVLAASADGDTINFDDSILPGTIALTSGQLEVNNNVTIAGPGATRLTVDGQFVPNPNEPPVNPYSRVFSISAGKDVRISGMTITRGMAPTYGIGGGILNQGTLDVTDVKFTLNTSSLRGGALCNDQGIATVSHCEFTSNRAMCGGAIYNTGQLFVDTCSFYENLALLGAAGMLNNDDPADATACSSRLVNCGFTLNTAPGFGSGTLFMTSAGGAVWNMGGNHTLVNCSFAGNQAWAGAGVLATAAMDADGNPVGTGSLSVKNCTFGSNFGLAGEGTPHESTDAGGILARNGVTVTIANSILWGNGAAGSVQQLYTDSASTTVTHSDMQTKTGNPWPGEGNICADPLFVRIASGGTDGWWDVWGTDADESANNDPGDVRLQPGSPCMASGSNTSIPADACDLDGDGDTTEPIPYDLDGGARVQGDAVDMGAYEFYQNTTPAANAGPDPLILA